MVCSSFLETILSHAYYNARAIDVFRSLIFNKDEVKEAPRGGHPALIPPVRFNCSYLEMLEEFASKGVICLGLYRHQALYSKPLPYVLANPKEDCVVQERDLVYVVRPEYY